MSFLSEGHGNRISSVIFLFFWGKLDGKEDPLLRQELHLLLLCIPEECRTECFCIVLLIKEEGTKLESYFSSPNVSHFPPLFSWLDSVLFLDKMCGGISSHGVHLHSFSFSLFASPSHIPLCLPRETKKEVGVKHSKSESWSDTSWIDCIES